MASAGALTREMMLEFSGEDKVEKVTILVLRGMGLSDVSALSLVPSLTSISLSHNDISAIPLPKGCLPMLLELNVNRNSLSSLSFLACCPNIQKLFAASNAFTSAAPLSECKDLTSACLHGNEISDLPGAISSLQALPNLQELELDGNPASSNPSYRNMCIGALKGLRILDGDAVLPKEREGAKHVAKFEERNATFWTHSDIHMPESDAGPRAARRPATSHHGARAAGSRPGSARAGGGCSNRPGSALLARSLAGASMSILEGGGGSCPSGGRNGLRDDFLNKNPILAEYMAAAEAEEQEEAGEEAEEDGEIRFIDSDATRAHDYLAESAASTRPASNAGTQSGKGRKGFATELRQVTETLSMVEGHSVDRIAALLDGDGEGAGVGESFGDRVERSLRPLTCGGRGRAGEDPKETITRLMAEVEMLRGGRAMRELEREVKMLRSETMNMRHFQEENASLRAQAEKLRNALEGDRIHDQNRRLKTQLKNLQARYTRLSEEAQGYGRPQTAVGKNVDMVCTAELLEEVDEYDSELADLMRRNVEMMSQIKEDLREMGGDASFEGEAVS